MVSLRLTSRLAAARAECQERACRKLVNFYSKPIYGGTSIKASQLFHLRPGLWQADIARCYQLNCAYYSSFTCAIVEQIFGRFSLNQSGNSLCITVETHYPFLNTANPICSLPEVSTIVTESKIEKYLSNFSKFP